MLLLGLILILLSLIIFWENATGKGDFEPSLTGTVISGNMMMSGLVFITREIGIYPVSNSGILLYGCIFILGVVGYIILTYFIYGRRQKRKKSEVD